MKQRAGRIAIASATLSIMIVTACGGEEESPLDRAADASASPTVSAEDEAIDVVERFWAERIRVESSGEYESANFDGILDPSMAETQTATYTTFDEGNFRRVGEPELGDYTAAIEGESAVVAVCVNEDDWGAEADAEVVEPEAQGWYPTSYALQAEGDSWLITGDADVPEDFTC